jgi:transcriptional regulator with XRE-family HTH domain
MQLGEKLRSLREGRGLLQRELAEAVGVTQVAIAHLEIGNRKPSFPMLIRLADFFGVSVDELARPTEKEGSAEVAQ